MAKVELEGELGYERIVMINGPEAQVLIIDDFYLANIVDLPRVTRSSRRKVYGRCRITIEQIEDVTEGNADDHDA